ncbi:MAG TPA: nucleotidyltransferase family protein [Polyangia bacterium]|nr:nucleotidyltransferase family protein [Polyangia bacterium]
MNSVADGRARLQLLLRGLNEPSRAASLDASDAELVVLARAHRLTPLLSVTCGNTLPAPLAEAFRRDRIITAARNMMLAEVAGECVRALKLEGVPAIVLKGLDYGERLYEAPGTRPTADVDLLIPGTERCRAFGVLDRLGFEPRAAAPGFDEPDYHEVAWTRGSVEIDLHMALAPLVRCRIDYQAVWRDAVPLRLGETDAQALSIPHAVVFQALHMAIDHFQVPAIYLIDVARLWEKVLDPARLYATAAAWHCLRPLRTALALTQAFLPGRTAQGTGEPDLAARRVVDAYGPGSPVTRFEQMVRKFSHFDRVADGIRYFVVQSRRNLREQLERRVRKRGPRQRLNLESRAR